ncbi:hypothetical protein V2J09_020426 [Rumex salicifolius]
MQDIHAILGGGGGAAGGGRGGPIFDDRRLRAAAQGLPHQQAFKCPRCDSSNTKFCYYNNYNLSQPRHFCKNCRRYWTNGGILRNVPVGGGCRKTKRSSKRKASSPAPSSQATPSTAVNDRQNKSTSRSSSESTSANTATKDQSAGGLAEAVGSGKVAVATESASVFSSPPVFKFSEKPSANYPVEEPTKPDCSVMSSNFTLLNEHGGIATENSGVRGIFTEIGGFSSFMSGNQNHNLFEFVSGGDVAPTPFRIHHQNQVNHQHENQLIPNPTAENWQVEKLDGIDHWGPGVLDQTIHLDLLPNSRSTDGGGIFAGSDWRGVSGGGDGRGHVSNLFDLTPGSSSAHGGHWSQSADQWHESDHDHHLYLPP